MYNYEDGAKEIVELYKSMTGRDLVPANTDFKRTYQYRYVVKFLKNMNEHNVAWDVVKNIACYAIQYAKENKGTSIWTRGLWVLTKSDIVDIACKKAQSESNRKNTDLEKVVKSKKFVQDNNFDFLRATEGAFPNIVMWYEQGKISLTYLAMSESCKNAYENLKSDDRTALPSQQEIVSRRLKCMLNSKYKKELQRALGNDYIKLIN